MSIIYEIFFTLLKSAIWNTTPLLPRKLSDKEWEDVFSISVEQTTTGIILDAIGRLPEEQRPGKGLRLKWILHLKAIERQNAHMNGVLAELLEGLEEKHIESFLLKGQGIAQCYPVPMHRTCGDIDLYFQPGHFENAIAHFTMLGCKITDKPDDPHAVTEYKGIKIELHRENATFYTRSLQKRYDNITADIIAKEDEATVNIGNKKVHTLPPVANALQLLSHMQRHIIFSGLGMRQICDWILFAKEYHQFLDNDSFLDNLEKLQLANTYKAISVIATDILWLPHSYLLCKTTRKDKRNAKKVLDLVLRYGNFGQYGEHCIHKTKSDYLKAYIWKVRNCIRFGSLAGSEAWSYPLWQLHTIKKML